MFAQQNDYPRYTVDDYNSWSDDTRMELIRGVIYMMSPSPRVFHQIVAGGIFSQISAYLKGKNCVVFMSPCDVILEETTVVQPDVFVVCDRTKIWKNGIHGAPDMIVEVLSPSTSSKDKNEKFNLYQRLKVREYWIVDPDTYTINVYTLKNNKYILDGEYGEDGIAQVRVLDDCAINLSEVFSTQYGVEE